MKTDAQTQGTLPQPRKSWDHQPLKRREGASGGGVLPTRRPQSPGLQNPQGADFCCFRQPSS